MRGFASVGVPLLDQSRADVPSSFLRQVCDYRKDAAVIVGCGAEVQLDEDGANVRLHGLFSDEQTLGDGVVGPPLSHQGKDGLFPVGKSVQRVTASGAIEQLGDDRRINDQPAGGDLSEGVRQLGEFDYRSATVEPSRTTQPSRHLNVN